MTLPRREEDKAAFKDAVKEAAKEWLDDQFTAFGKWTALGVAAAVFFALVKIAFITGEWPK